MPNGRIGIAIGRTRNRVAGATVTTEKPCECDNCFVTHLSIGIGDKHFNEISYQVGDANLSVTTPFTCDSMKSALADERNGIAQRLTKGFRRRIAGVMVQQEETEAPHLRIGVASAATCMAATGICLPSTARRCFDSAPHLWTKSLASSMSVRVIAYNPG
jgi:hypothetical protein